MKFLSNVGNTIKRTALKTKLRVSKHSPEILMVAGAVSFVATVVVACKQTLKCEEILDNHERKMKDIDDCLELASEEGSGVTYSMETAKKDRAIAFVQTGLDFAKLYAPAIGLGVVSLVSFGCGFNILKKRNLALTAAYGAIDTAFKEYRGRVKDELGEEADKHFRYGFETALNKKGTVAVKNENGETEVKEVDITDTVPWSESEGTLDNATFVFAPETSRYWFPDDIHNQAGISAARTRMQIDFDNNGYLFLNDVLKALGLKEVPYGQLVGWLKGYGDPYVDFRMKPICRPLPKNDKIRNPFNADYEIIYEFDFNTCGIIWDKI